MKLEAAVAVILMLATLEAHADVTALGWLTGCWAADGKEDGSIEQWSRPAGGTLFGFSRVVRNGQTVAFEYLRIVSEGDDIVLVASPSGQPTASFSLTSMTGDSVTFENPDHDFPQRIIYRLDDHEKLVGRIEGTIDNVARAVEFPMTRMSCDSGD